MRRRDSFICTFVMFNMYVTVYDEVIYIEGTELVESALATRFTGPKPSFLLVSLLSCKVNAYISPPSLFKTLFNGRMVQ